ncbi:MAG: hypothetical protein IH899_19655, partial [Planctomycetes bacterium]|nr:hypothetical protein [Planctomycetota bacterium]
SSSFALNAAFYLEALALIAAVPERKTGASKDLTHEEKQIYDRIIKIAKERFSQLDEDIKDYAMQQIQRTIKGNPDKQMAFMSYYFRKALGKKGERISDQMIARLGLANIFFWTSFIIYDDFMDEEGDPKVISTANLFARDFTSFKGARSRSHCETRKPIDRSTTKSFNRCVWKFVVEIAASMGSRFFSTHADNTRLDNSLRGLERQLTRRSRSAVTPNCSMVLSHSGWRQPTKRMSVRRWPSCSPMGPMVSISARSCEASSCI